jgi:hypothetical protein
MHGTPQAHFLCILCILWFLKPPRRPARSALRSPLSVYSVFSVVSKILAVLRAGRDPNKKPDAGRETASGEYILVSSEILLTH